jgi:hypothetical protein
MELCRKERVLRRFLWVIVARLYLKDTETENSIIIRKFYIPSGLAIYPRLVAISHTSRVEVCVLNFV